MGKGDRAGVPRREPMSGGGSRIAVDEANTGIANDKYKAIVMTALYFYIFLIYIAPGLFAALAFCKHDNDDCDRNNYNSRDNDYDYGGGVEPALT